MLNHEVTSEQNTPLGMEDLRKSPSGIGADLGMCVRSQIGVGDGIPMDTGATPWMI